MVWSRRRSSSSWAAILTLDSSIDYVQRVGIGLFDFGGESGQIGSRGGDHELLLAGGAGRFEPDAGSASGARPREDRRNRRTPLPCRAVPGKPALRSRLVSAASRLPCSRCRCWVKRGALLGIGLRGSQNVWRSSRACSAERRSAESGATRATSAATSRVNIVGVAVDALNPALVTAAIG